MFTPLAAAEGKKCLEVQKMSQNKQFGDLIYINQREYQTSETTTALT